MAKITKFKVQSRSGCSPSYPSNTFDFQASMDGSTWTTLVQVRGEWTSPPGVTKSIPTQYSDHYYHYYRFYLYDVCLGTV